MTRLPAKWLTHKAVVRRLAGAGAYGAVFADAEEVACIHVQGSEIVRSGEGDEVVSSSRIYVDPGVGDIPEGSVVEIDGEEHHVHETSVQNEFDGNSVYRKVVLR